MFFPCAALAFCQVGEVIIQTADLETDANAGSDFFINEKSKQNIGPRM